MECNPTEFIEERKYIYNKKEISITTQVTFDLSLACEEQCELLTFTVIFGHSKNVGMIVSMYCLKIVMTWQICI